MSIRAERPLGSGRIEARIGLRMMPTFPRSPLSFRTAAATQEIVRHTEEVANGTAEVSTNIGGVSRGIAATETAATRVLTATDQLGKQTASLRAEIDHFLADIQAA